MVELVRILNAVANAVGHVLLAPIAVVPGWLSATTIAIVTGIFMLWVFKYTSQQRSIRRVRDHIKSNLLALSLFQDDLLVSLRCQGRILGGACRLLLLALVPMLVMTLPICLLLGQLALWYQARPLPVGDEALLTVSFLDPVTDMPDIQLRPTAATEVTLGPVRLRDRHMVCWNVRGIEPGYHRLVFDIEGQQFEKELAVGSKIMRVSLKRPARQVADMLLHPAEDPLPGGSAMQAIELDYPDRAGWTCGTGWWLVYWFALSMVAAFVLRPWLKVNI